MHNFLKSVSHYISSHAELVILIALTVVLGWLLRVLKKKELLDKAEFAMFKTFTFLILGTHLFQIVLREASVIAVNEIS